MSDLGTEHDLFLILLNGSGKTRQQLQPQEIEKEVYMYICIQNNNYYEKVNLTIISLHLTRY